VRDRGEATVIAAQEPRTELPGRSSVSSQWEHSLGSRHAQSWEIDLAGSRTEAESRIMAAGRAEIDRLYRLAGLLLGDAADAEDATQEALLRAWLSAGSLHDMSHVQAWLDRILVNVCRDRLRRRQRIRLIVLTDDAPARSDPFQVVLDRDEVLRAMTQLDADQRIVVVLHYWAGLTLTDIAVRMGWPAGTVKSRLHHALERMRRRIVSPSPNPEAAP
jgi:RNA polymerase sigma-70 factor (ECF subfamily)